MEEQTFNNDNRDLRITEEGRAFLLAASKWAKFFAIIGFISIGLCLLMAIGYVVMGMAMSTEIIPGMSMLALGAIMFVIYGVYLFPIYFLYQFADKTRKAVDSNNQMSLTESLRYQKKMYEFLGITTIVMIGLTLLAVPLVMFFAVAI